ncbi:MAG: hypothetical protein ACPGAB_06835 [Flavobacteriales bacterium]
MKFSLAVGGWMMGCGLLVAQTPTSTRWHLPLDSEAWNVRLASDSAGVMVPSVQPMASWNRPAALQPQISAFEGLAVVGEARQIVGDFREPREPSCNAAATMSPPRAGGFRWAFPSHAKWPTTGAWTGWGMRCC